MKLIYHTTASALIAGILILISESWGLAIASFIGGVLIDMDHVFDYLYVHGCNIRINEFFDYFHEERHVKSYLIFHSWECMIIVPIVVILTKWNPWVTGFLIGYYHHMILDIICNAPSFSGLSFILRCKLGFYSEVIYPKGRKKRC